VTIIGIDHLQVAAPRRCEEDARAFYGRLLGLEEIPKPEPLTSRGGVWFPAGSQELHVGVEEPFAPARRAHPGLVAEDLDALGGRLEAAGHETTEDRESIPGAYRAYVHDPFGNRLELRQASSSRRRAPRKAAARSGDTTSG
jgi:catechol 2,3-dioxygenase-like lactoylglutathione lyase family enzyme